MAVPTMTGSKKLDRKLKALGRNTDRIGLAGVRKSVQVLAKQMKRSIPSRFKNARKGIGWRATKGRVANKRGSAKAAVAKAGVKVGIKKEKIKALGLAHKTSRLPKGSRKTVAGVGIGAETYQWHIKGTNNRRTKSGRNTGSTGAKQPGFARNAARAARVQMIREAAMAVKKQMIKEVRKAF